jgi:hypothetical protein
MRPAALEAGAREGLGDRRRDPAGAVRADQPDRLGVEAALDERGEQATPRGGRLGGGLPVVEELSTPVLVDPIGGEDDPLACPAGTAADRHPQPVDEQVASPEVDRPTVERGDLGVERPSKTAD